MSDIFVSGLVNVETSCPVRGFPLDYFPIDYPFHQIQSAVSGVALNLCSNFKGLGDDVTLVSMTGNDVFAPVVLAELNARDIETRQIFPILSATPQSVILYAPDSRREIYCDLKDYQEKSVDFQTLLPEIRRADVIVACNSNFNRPLLHTAKKENKYIATDLHVLGNPRDEYNWDFIQAADIIFLSDEALGEYASEFVRELASLCSAAVIAVGQGSRGALLFERRTGDLCHFPAIATRPVRATSGAGDCLFSTFLHYSVQGKSAGESLRRAMLAASWKIGEAVSSHGFLNAEELEELWKKKKI